MHNKLVWIDCEMTGLDVEKDAIVEIATIVTDMHLNIIEEGPNLIIHAKEEALSNLSPWVQKTHSESGLLDKVRLSSLSLAEAEKQTLAFIQNHVAKGEAPLCGNSIGTDRAFLKRGMPTLESFLHYRNVDVSTIKILYHGWVSNAKSFAKEGQHRALDDIKESIAELAYYRECFFSIPSAS